jgi:hypothetical protein
MSIVCIDQLSSGLVLSYNVTNLSGIVLFHVFASRNVYAKFSYHCQNDISIVILEQIES